MKPLQFMYPFEDQPPAGKAVTVFMKDGSKQTAVTGMVHSSGFSGLQWYRVKRGVAGKAIDVNEIKGWLPR